MFQLSTFLRDLIYNRISPNNYRVCLSNKGEARKLFFFFLSFLITGKHFLLWGTEVGFSRAGMNGRYLSGIKRGCNLVSEVSSSRIYKYSASCRL